MVFLSALSIFSLSEAIWRGENEFMTPSPLPATAISKTRNLEDCSKPAETLTAHTFMYIGSDLVENYSFDTVKADAEKMIETANGVLTNHFNLRIQVEDWDIFEIYNNCKEKTHDDILTKLDLVVERNDNRRHKFNLLLTNCRREDYEDFAGLSNIQDPGIPCGDPIICSAFAGYYPLHSKNNWKMIVFIHEFTHNLGVPDNIGAGGYMDAALDTSLDPVSQCIGINNIKARFAASGGEFSINGQNPVRRGISERRVSCGDHSADSCEQCAEGNGKTWCNGDCQWKNDNCSKRTACDEDKFTCVADKQCIPEQFRCDHYSDCVDGSDEQDCYYSTSSAQTTVSNSYTGDSASSAQTPVSNTGERRVSCGFHSADSCEQCPRDKGEQFCNGDCQWKNDNCSKRTDTTKSCTERPWEGILKIKVKIWIDSPEVDWEKRKKFARDIVNLANKYLRPDLFFELDLQDNDIESYQIPCEQGVETQSLHSVVKITNEFMQKGYYLGEYYHLFLRGGQCGEYDLPGGGYMPEDHEFLCDSANPRTNVSFTVMRINGSGVTGEDARGMINSLGRSLGLPEQLIVQNENPGTYHTFECGNKIQVWNNIVKSMKNPSGSSGKCFFRDYNMCMDTGEQYCSSISTYCGTEKHGLWMSENCKKTCGECRGEDSSPDSSEDSSPDSSEDSSPDSSEDSSPDSKDTKKQEEENKGEDSSPDSKDTKKQEEENKATSPNIRCAKRLR